MGVDISGLKPVTKYSKPDKSHFNRESDFFDAIKEWESKHPGFYYKRNFWTWRPIHAVAQRVNESFDLGFNMERWGENSGYGLKNQLDCRILADSIDKMMFEYDADSIQVCYGSWNTWSGYRLTEEEKDSLNEDYPKGTILYSSITLGSEIVISNHYATREDFSEFTEFLRNCGGFEIW
jgi:hypothetical protein